MAEAPRVEWPSSPVSLAEAARLITAAGHKVDRTNLGRFIASRDFPHTTRGAAKLVDARALNDAYTSDYSRRVMSGEATRPPPAAPVESAPAPAGRAQTYDPKREETELKVQQRRIELAQQLRRIVPVEEVEAAMAEALADLRAAFARERRAFAAQAMIDLGLPAEREGALRAVLKRYDRIGQEAFANRLAMAAAAPEDSDATARTRLARLTGLSLRLRPSVGLD